MLDNVFHYMDDFLTTFEYDYMDIIRGDDSTAFTRKRKMLPYPLLLQMFAQGGKAQDAELEDFYSKIDIERNVSTVAFYNARMKFNPEAIHVMAQDFISMIYLKENESMVKLNSYIVTAIDGSDFILPSTDENAKKYGRAVSSNQNPNNCPVMGKMSVIYDCINKMVFDVQVGEYKHSERDFASTHLKELKEAIYNPTITTFDRGYFSFQLALQMMDDNQKFVFRLRNMDLRKYVDQIDTGGDKEFEITFDRETTNQYRRDVPFRTKLMNTTLKVRIVKVPILNKDTGKMYEEILLTNLTTEEFDIDGIKELYHLRWNIETAYNTLKNRMKIEEFSGYRETLILQDIYSCVWLYNIVMLQIVEVNEKNEIPQDRYKYEMRRNVNVAIGVMKTKFVKSIIHYKDKEEQEKNITYIHKKIKTSLVPVRADRHNKRKVTSHNKSRMSYRYTY